MFRIVQTPVIGLPQPSGWAQVLVNTAQNLVCVISLSGENAGESGRLLATEIIALQPTSALELHQAVENFLLKTQAQQLALQMAAGLLLDGSCVLVTYNGHISLQRQGKVGQLLSSQDEIKVIEGLLKDHDVFILSTRQAEDYLNDIHQQLNLGADGEALATYLASKIETHPQASLMAVSYVLVAPGREENVVDLATGTSEQTSKPAKTLTPIVFLENFKKLRYRVLHGATTTFSSLQTSIKSSFSGDVYVRRERGKKVMKIALPIVLILLLVGGAIFYVQRDQAKQRAEAEAIIGPAENKLHDIQNNVNQDPVKARQDTEDLINQLQGQVPKFQNKSIALAELQTEISHLKDFSQSISGQQQLTTLPTFFDFSWVKADFIASRVDLASRSMIFLDTGQKKMIAVDIDKKQQSFISTGDVPSMKDISFDGKNIFVLSNGIYQVNIASPAAQLIKPDDDSNHDAQFIRSFGKNIYVFNSTKKNIFRYAPKSDGTYSDPIGWLHSTADIAFDTVSSFAIDGDVWLAFKDGSIRRFSAGKSAPFTINGLKDPLTTPIQLFIKDSTNNLYVLEPQKNRVVVLSKTGDFLREIKSNSLATATAVTADESQQKAYALSGSLVYQLNLQ